MACIGVRLEKDVKQMLGICLVEAIGVRVLRWWGGLFWVNCCSWLVVFVSVCVCVCVCGNLL